MRKQRNSCINIRAHDTCSQCKGWDEPVNKITGYLADTRQFCITITIKLIPQINSEPLLPARYQECDNPEIPECGNAGPRARAVSAGCGAADFLLISCSAAVGRASPSCQSHSKLLWFRCLVWCEREEESVHPKNKEGRTTSQQTMINVWG